MYDEPDWSSLSVEELLEKAQEIAKLSVAVLNWLIAIDKTGVWEISEQLRIYRLRP